MLGTFTSYFVANLDPRICNEADRNALKSTTELVKFTVILSKYILFVLPPALSSPSSSMSFTGIVLPTLAGSALRGALCSRLVVGEYVREM